MAKVRLFLDVSVVHSDGTSPIKIMLADKSEASKITTGISVKKAQWNKTTCKVKAHPLSARINNLLTEKLCEAQLAMLEGQKSAIALSPKEVRRQIQPNVDMRPTLDDMFRQMINDKRKSERTRDLYRETLDKVVAFKKFKGYGRLVWEDIKPGWLNAFDQWLVDTGSNSANSRSIHLRVIRTAFNRALCEELTMYYPFRLFKIKGEKTRKRSLSAEKLHALLVGPAAPWTEIHQKYARLIFFLRGINIKDLSNLKWTDIEGDYIQYKRAKGGHIYQIKLEPETKQLIEELGDRSTEYILPIVNRYKCYRTFTMKFNNALKHIGPWKYIARGQKTEYEPVCSKASSYWLRHTWATVAAELDIPKETISEGLGHEIGSDITSIYINFNQKKVDEANRKIIDYVLGNTCHSEASEVVSQSVLDSADS